MQKRERPEPSRVTPVRFQLVVVAAARPAHADGGHRDNIHRAGAFKERDRAAKLSHGCWNERHSNRATRAPRLPRPAVS